METLEIQQEFSNKLLHFLERKRENNSNSLDSEVGEEEKPIEPARGIRRLIT